MIPRLLATLAVLAACGDDGGTRLPPDARPGPDGPVVDAAVGIECRTTFCELPEICCAERMDRNTLYSCVPRDNPEFCLGSRFRCDGPEDCGEGETCCTGGTEGDVACVPDGSCENYIVCHVTAHCPPPLACADTPFGLIRACQ